MTADLSSFGHPNAPAGEKAESATAVPATPAEARAVEQAGEQEQERTANAAEGSKTEEAETVTAGEQAPPNVEGDAATGQDKAEEASERRIEEPRSELEGAAAEPAEAAEVIQAAKEEGEAAAAALAAAAMTAAADTLASDAPHVETPPLDTGDGRVSPLAAAQTESESSKAAKPRLNLPKNPVPELQLLTFYSWWTEMNTKRYIEICFDMKTQLFQVVLDKEVKHLTSEQLYSAQTESLRDVTAKDTKVMSMHLHEKLSGNQHAQSLRRQHLCQWDLHVGAKLNILGRPTTLMQCSATTGQWLDYQAEKLTRIKKALEEHLRRYETIPKPAVFSAKTSEKGKSVGKTDLRVLLNLIDGLQQRLSRYRPTIAAGIAALVEQQPDMPTPFRLES